MDKNISNGNTVHHTNMDGSSNRKSFEYVEKIEDYEEKYLQRMYEEGKLNFIHEHKNISSHVANK